MAGEASTASEFDLRAVTQILRRRLWVIALVLALASGVSFATASAKTRLYSASSQVLVAQSLAEGYFSPVQSYVDPNRALANQIRVIQGGSLQERVQVKLGYAAGIAASHSETEDVVTLSATDTDPERAAAIANAYADAYIEYRREQAVGNTRAAEQEIARRILDTKTQLDLLDRQGALTSGGRVDPAQEALTTQRASLAQTLVGLQAQLGQLQSSANVQGTGTQLLARASAPRSPFEPKPMRTAALGAIVGLMLGLGLAFISDYLDDRVRGREDVHRVNAQMPILGLIPTLPGWRNKRSTRLISIEDPRSSAAESYRALRTSIQFLGLDSPLKLLQITSSAASEGKTTTVTNLAVSLARAGQRVIVVDCDLRRPRVHEFFDLPDDVGFTSVLLGDIPLSGAIFHVPGVENLRVVPAGPIPPNPSELLSGSRALELLHVLRADADIVLVDSPPILPVADSAAIAAQVDATLLVVSAQNTHRRQFGRALELLKQVDASIIGVVLNGLGSGVRYGYGYRYGYKPYVKEEVRERRRSRAKATEEEHSNR